MFDDILEIENAFLSYRNKEFKDLNNFIFFKGLIHGFGQKN